MAGPLKTETVIKRLGESLIIAYMVARPSVRVAFGRRTKAHTGYYAFESLELARIWRARQLKYTKSLSITIHQFGTLAERNAFIQRHPKV